MHNKSRLDFDWRSDNGTRYRLTASDTLSNIPANMTLNFVAPIDNRVSTVVAFQVEILISNH